MKAEAKAFFAVVGGAIGVFLARRLVWARVAFRLTNLIINPSTVQAGETVDISVTITNIGRQAGTKRVRLRVLSTFVENITLNPRESGVVHFTVTPGEAGTYNIRIDGMAGRFTVLPVTVPVPVPPPIYATLADAQGRLAQFQDNMSAILYRSTDYPIQQRVIINSIEGTSDYEVPTLNLHHSARATALTSKTDLYIAWKPNLWAINKYKITPGQGLTFISQTTLGDSKSMIHDMIRLASGKLVVAWHEGVSDMVNNSLDIGFAYTDSAGNWHTLPYVNVASLDGNWGNPASRGALAQNYDGSIWYFWARDGFGCLWAIKLVESRETLKVTRIFNPLIPEKDILPSKATVLNHYAPDGELPVIRTCSVADGVLVGYPRNWDRLMKAEIAKIFGFIQVIKILPDGSYSLVQEATGRSQRTDMFAIGEGWIAYGKYDESTLTWNDLILETPQTLTELGILQRGYKDALPSTAITMYGTKYWLAAQMSDGYIRFFKVQ